MQTVRIIGVASFPDQAAAQAAVDAVADVLRPVEGTVETAPFTFDLAAKRKAEWEAEREAAAAAKALADRSDVERVYVALDADVALDRDTKDKVRAIILAATGKTTAVAERI
ncbi:MAG TPA: hypothetical protein VMW52_11480 [Phycisphaerae bacterium]|nr:hypothetical protein [Phycisphaerae bacterium]